MPAFTGPLRLDFGDWGSGVGRIAILLEPLTWRGITVPTGFMTDGASVPRILWAWLPPWGDVATRAAIVHDYLLERRDDGIPVPGAETRAKCDQLFYEALLDCGVGKFRARLTWLGVRLYALSGR